MTVTKLEIVRSAIALDISDEVAYVHENNDGFGMAPFERFEDRGPLQHGSTDHGYRLQPRDIPLVVTILGGSSWDTFWSRRETLIRYLNPNGSLALRFTLPNSKQRQLDCFAVRGPSFATDGMMGKNIKAGFILRANDPTWYDPMGKGLVFSLGGSNNPMVIPMTVPFGIGAVNINQSYPITYEGTAPSYPTISLYGPISSPSIQNSAGGYVLFFPGVTIPAGDHYTIDLRYGYKLVTNAAGTRKNGELASYSSLEDFCLLPATDGSAARVNSINVQGVAVDGSTRIEILYNDRYLGI